MAPRFSGRNPYARYFSLLLCFSILVPFSSNGASKAMDSSGRVKGSVIEGLSDISTTHYDSNLDSSLPSLLHTLSIHLSHSPSSFRTLTDAAPLIISLLSGSPALRALAPAPQSGSISKPFDYDHDGKTDISVWRPTDGNWFIKRSSDGVTETQSDWGRESLGDKIVPADYDGDGKTDKAIFRPSEGNWYIIQSSNGSPVVKNWGNGGDTPVPGDYDGDGKADVAVYRPSEGNWYVRNSSDGSTRMQFWGNTFDVPVPGDYDGDHKTDLAVVRPLENNWYILQSSNGTVMVQWGNIGDKLVPADYDGDGRTDIAIFRSNEGNWYIRQSSNGNVVLGWGNSSDIPVPGDYDGDGSANLAVYRPSEGNWYIRNFGGGAQNLGLSSDVPTPSAFLKSIVQPPPQPPVAVPGGPYQAANILAVKLNGGNSYDPDGGAINSYNWNFGDNQTGTGRTPTHLYTSAGTYTITLTVTDSSGATSAPASTTVTVTDFTTARLDPNNRTGQDGEDILSRNFNWTLPLVSLPGRAGHDLGLSLSYNSLVWLKSGNHLVFDADRGFPGPGFRLGFPVLEPKYHNSQTNLDSYLMITSSGSRIELRRVGTTSIYLAADSSYIQLNEASMTVTTTDGTQLSYGLSGNSYRCERTTDRNGNYMTVNYTPAGQIDTVIDTLGRTITFKYDSTNGRLTSIEQSWTTAGQTETYYWARFNYKDDLAINTSFNGQTVIGPQNGTTIPVLERVTLADDSSYKFSYSAWGQIYRITRYAADSLADNHPLTYTDYNLNNPGPQDDCPRFTERRDWAERWNDSQEATTYYTAPANTSKPLPDGSVADRVSQIKTPDGTYHQVYTRSSGWDKGLPLQVDTYGAEKAGAATQLQRSLVTKWTQDNTSLAYPLNPRVQETTVSDTNNNERRTTVSYQSFTLPSGASCSLPQDVSEYDGVNIYRHTWTEYNLSNTYLNRSIIGLVREQRLYAGAGTTRLSSKVSYEYDEAGYLTDRPSIIQHDSAYSLSFVQGRGLLTSVRRWNVEHSTDVTESVISSMGYDIAGSVTFKRDPLWQPSQTGHEVNISYTDSFSDGNNARNTFAYPTTITDADGFPSTIQYNHQSGAVTRAQTPPPQGFAQGPVLTFEYDAAGRRTNVSTLLGGAVYRYTRWVYPTSQTVVNTYTTIKTGAGEAFSTTLFDGAGRVRATATELPSSLGAQYSGQIFVYDVMGRRWQTSYPTETSATGEVWDAIGADATTGWRYVTQTYDWKSRPLVTTNADGTTRELTYGGCGCAGGEVVTIKDEVNRRRRVTDDILGRTWKTEVLNPDGIVYSTTTNSYNVRDQITTILEQAGSGGTGQTTTLDYDGHARLKTKQAPAQTGPTSYQYYSDDKLKQVTDARGAITTFTYDNGRRLLTKISYTGTGMSVPPDVSFGYDAAGNRTSMTDGSGSVSYAHDQLSRLTSESRQFAGLSGTFTVGYEYNLADGLTSITDPAEYVIYYADDKAGHVTGITGTSFAGITQYASDLKYRAWGALKSASYGDNRALSLSYNAKLQPSDFVVTNPQGYAAPNLISKHYDYYDDGSLRYSQDLMDNRFDRSYIYDHVGRVTQAYSGPAARGAADNINSPYRLSFSYDALNHLTSRTGRVWNDEQVSSNVGSSTYNNDKNDGWIYDADGRLTDSNESYYVYDAAGHIVTTGSDDETLTQEQVFDGDGQRTKLHIQQITFNPNGTMTTTNKTQYFVTSSVLRGVVTELNESGQKSRTFVYQGEQILAWQQQSPGTQSIAWEHRDAADASVRIPGAPRGSSSELDPTGSDAGATPPLQRPPGDEPGKQFTYPGFASAEGSECRINGMDVPCGVQERLMEAGALAVEYREERTALWKVPEQRDIEPKGAGIFITEGPSPIPGSLDIRWTSRTLTDDDFYGHSQNINLTNPKNEEQLKAKLNECTKKLFGVELRSFYRSRPGNNGTFTGYGVDRLRNGGFDTEITVVNNANTYTMSDLGRNRTVPGGPVMGITYTSSSRYGQAHGFDPYTNFTGRDLNNSSAILATQIHELGNSLRDITGVTMDPNPVPGIGKDTDAGTRLERCVFGGEYDQNGRLHRFR